MIRRPPSSTLFPYTPLSRSRGRAPRRLRLAYRARASTAPLPPRRPLRPAAPRDRAAARAAARGDRSRRQAAAAPRSEEHTSELQSLAYLVCRLLLEKKKKKS